MIAKQLPFTRVKALFQSVLAVVLLAPFARYSVAAAPIHSVNTCAASIDFGQTLQCAISTAGEVDTLTFSAQAGDLVLVRMSATSGNLDPHIRLNDTDGATTLCSAYDYSGDAEIATCTLPASGTYTLLAADYGNTDTGNYALYLQRLNNPVDPIALAYGQTLSGSIVSPAELDAYTFTATSGDIAVVQIARTSGSLDTHARIYNTDGTLVCTMNGLSSALSLATCSLPASGSYSLLTGDQYGRNTGIYNLFLQRLNTPAGGTALPYAETRSGTIVAAAEMDAYTFLANVGDIVRLRANATSAGGLDVYLQLYDPAGLLVCSDYAYDTDAAQIPNCALASAGNYTLLVGDYGGLDVGNYDVFLQKVKAPVNATPLAINETVTGITAHAAELLAYTFQANAGDVIAGQVGIPDRSLDPHIWLYAEDGTLVCNDHAYTSISESAAGIHCLLPADGIYLILMGTYEYSSRQVAGAYQLHIQRLNPPVNPATLYFGWHVSTSIAKAAEMDTYAFRAASGDVVSVRMNAAKLTIDPYIRLYGTDGVKLCENYDLSSFSDATAEIASCTLPFSGTYTLLASDYGANEIGTYTLYLDCLGPSCGFPPELNEKLYLPLVVKGK